MPISQDSRTLSVCLVAVPEASAAVVYGLHEVFVCVSSMWETLTGEATQSRKMKPRIVGAKCGPLRTTIGATIVVEHSFAEALRPDIVIVSDLNLATGTLPVNRWPQEVTWLKEQHARGAIICSVCSGSLMLAEAGLLNDREATSHWGVRDYFEQYYKGVDLRIQRVLVPSGTSHDVVTSGGSASWTDLSLYLVARFCGAAEARHIAKIFLFGDRGEGQLPFAAMVRPRQHEDAVIAECQSWIADNYGCTNPVAAMTKRSGLAPRTFKRRFHAATGYTAIDYAQTLRIEEAKQILETTDTPVDDVAESVGYEDPNSFRRLFKRLVGSSPHKYRQRYQAVAMAQ